MYNDAQFTPPGKDPERWMLARKRASFKRHLLTYVLINAFLWAIWFFTGARTHGVIPWPAWAALGWGVGLASHYLSAYHSSGTSDIEKEYDKLSQHQTK
jgi:hypothetical protein